MIRNMNQSIGENSSRGTEFKLNICMPPVDGHTLSEVDFTVDVFTEHGGRELTIHKSEAIKVDENNYIICVDSSITGAGKYLARLTAYIPDPHFSKGYRREIKTKYIEKTINAI